MWKGNLLTKTGVKRNTDVPRYDGPPRQYDHKQALLNHSITLVARRWPQILDLAQSGTVVAIPRSPDYKERRKDGYIEPEVVVLVGTAHISSKSAEEVRRVILSTRPRNVVVELCRSRVGQMYAKQSSEKLANPMSLAGEGSLLQTFRRSVELGGDKALILRLMLASLSTSLQKRLNIENGLEFVAAREAAESINAEIVLGDRPIEISLQRAWDSLTTSQRMSFLADLVKGTVSVGKAEPEAAVELIEKLRMDDDMLSSMLRLFTDSSSEGAVRALLHERDLYLAWSLKRSKAVNGADVVVGVIGKGHLRGVCYALTHNPNGLRFRDIAGSKRVGSSSNSQNRLLQLTIRITTESILFLILWKILGGQ